MDNLVRELLVARGYDKSLNRLPNNNANNDRLVADFESYIRAAIEKPRVEPKLSFEVS